MCYTCIVLKKEKGSAISVAYLCFREWRKRDEITILCGTLL